MLYLNARHLLYFGAEESKQGACICSTRLQSTDLEWEIGNRLEMIINSSIDDLYLSRVYCSNWYVYRENAI